MEEASPSLESKVLIRSAVPTFLVADVTNTARWYEANLGFQTAGTAPPQEPHVYASLQRGSAELMLAWRRWNMASLATRARGLHARHRPPGHKRTS